MASTFRRLSSLLLTSSLSPSEDPARAVLQARADHFSNLVTWSTVVVAIGVALEGVEIVHDGIVWIKRNRREKRELILLKEVAETFPSDETKRQTELHSDHPRWVKRVLRLGLIAVVIGVVGEWRYGAKLEDSHNAIHKYDVEKLTAAENKAGDAARSAKDAHDLGVDLLGKYKAAEHEIVELKAAKLPRRLSSDQKATFRRAVASFKVRTFNISCSIPGGNMKEPLDFELDFVDAIDKKTPVQFQYRFGCMALVGFRAFIPPIQVEAGADRADDEETLIKALIDMGINKKEITKTNADSGFLGLTIGPKAP